jgi:hypothetical protein
VLRRTVFLAGLLALALGGLVLPVRWETRRLVLWGTALDEFRVASGPTEALSLFVREVLSWWWLAAGVLYLLPVLLLPLAGSFARNQVLWLRLTPCSARELALGRAVRVVVASALLGGLGLAAVGVCALWHGLPARSLLPVGLGPGLHALAAGGLLLVCGPRLLTPVGRALAAFLVFLAPLISFLLFVTLRPHLPTAVAGWWPYVVPFAPDLGRPLPHLLGTAGLGLAALLVAAGLQPGHDPLDSLSLDKELLT